MRGLVAQKRTGHFGRTWWGKQVEQALEEPYRRQDYHNYRNSAIRHPHVTRAKALARNGSVLAMEHYGTTVAGEVQGSQLSPFSPTITCAPVSAATIAAVRTAIAQHPGSAEEIIAGTLPAFLEDLLPLGGADLHCACTCPAIDQRCSHTLALGYLLVERMDRDSEWYLQLRGISLGDILVSTDPVEAETNTTGTTVTIPRGEQAQRITRPAHADADESKTDTPIAIDSYRYWSLSGELPEVPHPLPDPAYKDLDPVQRMAAATAYTNDPVDKLTMESDLHDAWDFLTGDIDTEETTHD